MAEVRDTMSSRVTGAEARRVKREVLGVPDRIKHQRRVAVPMQRRAPEAGNRRRAYRYRCYPSPSQAEQLIKTFGACRWTYNEGLALRDKAWREHRVSIGFAACRALTGWRNAEGTRWLQEVGRSSRPSGISMRPLGDFNERRRTPTQEEEPLP
ncbi:hypothetical protein SMICM304S_02243 [Streptomyces microflavus]